MAGKRETTIVLDIVDGVSREDERATSALGDGCELSASISGQLEADGDDSSILRISLNSSDDSESDEVEDSSSI